jgi:parallel beta-helix repeat protein
MAPASGLRAEYLALFTVLQAIFRRRFSIMFPITTRHGRQRSSSRQATYRPRLEGLEDRTMPATFLVTNTGDDNGVDPAPFAGTGTLRQAIIDAGQQSVPAVIAFAIPMTDSGYNSSTGAFRIQPLSPLPEIGSAVADNNPETIDGTTQPGYTNHPLIELNGALAGTASGLVCGGGVDTIKGLVINSFSRLPADINTFSGYGIYLRSDNNTVTGCYIGTDVTGTETLGNQGAGILVQGGGNTIGGTAPGEGNVISGNGSPQGSFPGGVVLAGPNNVVEGNLIGLTADGNSALGNSPIAVGPYTLDNTAIADVVVLADNNVIGGPSPGARNVISGCADGDGIQVEAQVTFQATLQGVVIQGNYIGTNKDGNAPLGNEDGVGLYARGPIGTRIIGALIEDNLISGNARDGILVTGSDDTMITGNYIGTDATGMHALGNGSTGLYTQAGNITIDGNLISANGGGALGSDPVLGNGKEGIEFLGAGLSITNSIVQGNKIGTDAAGNPILGNSGDGVLVSHGYGQKVTDTLIGGTATGAANVIAGNFGAGVGMLGSETFDNRIQGNSIYANGGLGIDLGDDGVSTPAANDAANHLGPNNLMNFPILTAASFTATGTIVSGTLDTNTVGGPYPAGALITLDFYANTAPDATGYGQGQTWLGSYILTADGTANLSFTTSGLAPLPAGQDYLTATATDANGNTSEFGRDVPVPTASAGGPYTMTYGGSLTLNATGSDPAGNPLSYSWTVNGHAGAASGASPTLTWAQLNALGVTVALPFSVNVTADNGHGGTATSADVPVTVSPAPLTVIANDSLMLVGNSPLPLTGSVNGTSLTGAIAYTTAYGDTVTVTLNTQASAGSPVGQYAITATLSGATAGNYILAPVTSRAGTMYVVILGADPTSTVGAQAVVFWDNKGNAKLITSADLSSLDALNLVRQAGTAFDPSAVKQLQAWLSAPPNATTSYQLAVQLAAMDLNVLAGYVQGSDLVYASGLLPYATAYEIAGLTSGGFIDVQSLMSAANAELGADPRALEGDPNQAYEAALAQALQAANANKDFVQQELAWNLVSLYLQGGL